MKLKLTYIFHRLIRWVAFEWAAKYIDRSKFEVDFLLLNPQDPMIPFLEERGIPYTTIEFNDYANTPEVTKFIYDHLKKNKTDIVHTHFFAAHITGLQAAFYANVPVRVFTRHHSGIKWALHKRSKSKFELVWEMATDAIALTGQGKQIMIADGVPEEKITIIPHGFDVTEFEQIAPERVQKLRDKYGIHPIGPVIGTVGRYIGLKGINYTIEAFKKVLEVHPNALLVLAGTHTNILNSGKSAQTFTPPKEAANIQAQLQTLPPNSFVEISFENDLQALYQLFDILVHVPISQDAEAFCQVYIETMLSQVPSVITRSAAACDYAVHQENTWVVDFKNSEQIAEGILALLADETLREKIKRNALVRAKKYNIERKIHAFEALYLKGFERHQQSLDKQLIEVL